MSYQQFQSEVVSLIEAWQQANFPATDLCVDNGPLPEEDKVSSPWVDVSFRPYGGKSLAVGGVKAGRINGVVAVSIFTRQGDGTAQATRMQESLIQELSDKRVAGGNLAFPTPFLPIQARGWFKLGLMFPFYVDV